MHIQTYTFTPTDLFRDLAVSSEEVSAAIAVALSVAKGEGGSFKDISAAAVAAACAARRGCTQVFKHTKVYAHAHPHSHTDAKSCLQKQISAAAAIVAAGCTLTHDEIPGEVSMQDDDENIDMLWEQMRRETPGLHPQKISTPASETEPRTISGIKPTFAPISSSG